MKIFNSIESFSNEKRTIVTIGTFDGVHLGHRKIVEQLVAAAKQEDCESLILTFFPHPRMVLQGPDEISLLNTIEERTQLLEQTGLDNLVIHPFDHDFSKLSAEEFVRSVLVQCFKAKKIIIGYDHRFGKNRSADINDLIIFGSQYGFEVERIPAEQMNDVSISSTKIRQSLSLGNIPLANSYLGYNYFMTGTVMHGKQLGRTIGFPTANLAISANYKLIPAQGVYVVKSIIAGVEVNGMMNIGTNPTVGGQKLSVEVHLLDFSDDLYGKEISISLLAKLRDEQKFESIDALKEQLHSDEKQTRAFFK